MGTPEKSEEAWAPLCPQTVGELMARLRAFSPETPISFGPWTLYRVRDVGELVHFEMNETLGERPPD